MICIHHCLNNENEKDILEKDMYFDNPKVHEMRQDTQQFYRRPFR